MTSGHLGQKNTNFRKNTDVNDDISTKGHQNNKEY